MKALNVVISGAKIAAPLVSLPAISVPALSTFTEVSSYWEDRTKFVMAGNLTTAVATRQALDDPERDAHYIGLLSGDYVMVRRSDTDELAKELPELDLLQGYLVRKDADPNLPLETRAESAVPGITYASMRVSVQPLDASSLFKSATSTGGGGPSGASGGKKETGKKESGGKTKEP